MSEKIDDQMLMAYVDAELSAAESKEVELFLAGNHEAQETVERYQQTRNAIGQFADILDEPVPDHLIDTIHQRDDESSVVQLSNGANAGFRWVAVAASLVIGVGLGALSMDYLVVQPSEEEASIAANKVAELSDALKAMKAEKETVEKNMEKAENKTAEAQEQLSAANKDKAKADSAEGIFPFKLVSEAIENGSNLSAADQENVLDELNKEKAMITTASSFSKLIRKSNDAELTANTSNYETLGDVEKSSAETAGSTKEVLGEFTYSGKTCRLIKFTRQGQSAASTLVTCRGGSGNWEIVRGR